MNLIHKKKGGKIMIKYNYSMLRGRIRELFGSEKKFAETLRKEDVQMSTGTFNSRINGYTYFKQPEIEKICILLNIDLKDIKTYFFTQKYEFNS